MIHDILDLHTHTIMSGHAYNTMQEMIRSASEKGVRLLGITEHAPAFPAPAIRFISSISGLFPGNSSE
mgnify:CR=1 FL=1